MKILTSIKSWKTTAVSIIGAVAIVAGEAKNALDDDPKTVFNWESVKAALVILGVGILAKDGDKSSKSLGI